MSRLTISPPEEISPVQVSVDLPVSKSILNRVLMLKPANVEMAIANERLLPTDIQILINALHKLQIPQSHPLQIDAEDAGTAMRFLTSLLAYSEGEFILLGSSRMYERPISPLVDALLENGARINYLKTTGFPPLSIRGIAPKGCPEFHFGENSSSQYISSCLLLASKFPSGLSVSYSSKQVSSAYIELTIKLLLELGFGVRRKYSEGRHFLYISGHVESIPDAIWNEGDWSSAAFLYGITGLLKHVRLKFANLNPDSAQGDAVLPGLFEEIGVHTQNRNGQLHIECSELKKLPEEIDFTNIPDLVPAYVVYCALRKIPFKGRGLEHLRIKESDRIHSLQHNLRKIGMDLTGSHGVYALHGELTFPGIPEFESFGDHRIAMAFAQCAALQPVRINDAEVVGKSFPGFWDELRRIGFNIES